MGSGEGFGGRPLDRMAISYKLTGLASTSIHGTCGVLIFLHCGIVMRLCISGVWGGRNVCQWERSCGCTGVTLDGITDLCYDEVRIFSRER